MEALTAIILGQIPTLQTHRGFTIRVAHTEVILAPTLMIRIPPPIPMDVMVTPILQIVKIIPTALEIRIPATGITLSQVVNLRACFLLMASSE
jgi:hypothetical protein